MTGSAPAPKKHPSRLGNRQAENDKFHNFKVCSECGEKKRMADFALNTGWRKKRAADPTRYKHKCKKCSRAPSAIAVDPGFKPHRTRAPAKPKSKAEKRAAAAKYKRKARRETRIRALRYLAEKGCCECGSHDPRILEFDHIDTDEKSADISRLLADGFSWGAEKLRAEIRKCRVICANCHRKHTIIQQEYYGHPDVDRELRKLLEKFDIT